MRIKSRLYSSLRSLFLLGCGAGAASLAIAQPSAQAGRLRSPWDDRLVTLTDASYTCPAKPMFARTTEAEGYYTDSHYSVIDPAKLAATEKADEDLTRLGQYAGKAADAYLEQGSRQAAQCAYALLAAAAKADAWTGRMPHLQGIYDQNWLLSGAGIAYLKVRNSGVGASGDDAAIAAWLARLAAPVSAYFDRQLGRPGSDAYNNHLYWAGLSLCAEGVATNDEATFLWGMDAYMRGVEAIRADGSLLAEMNRERRALHYQLYALGPLVMLAEFGEANGIDLYAEQSGALHRLVRFDTEALRDPDGFAETLGVAQDFKPPARGLEIGWAVPYAARFPDEAKALKLKEAIAAAPWLSFWQWGGAPPQPVLPRPALTPAQAAFEAKLKQGWDAEVARSFASDPSAEAAFLGDWCTMGDPASHSFIRRDEHGLSATNEHGDSSWARTAGKAEIAAPAWLGVKGSLSDGGRQIDWTNGTFWERCSAIGKAPQPFHLSGRWYSSVDSTHPCRLKQHGMQLKITCGRYGNAAGALQPDGTLSVTWSGRQIAGQVTADGRHILWANQTFWTHR